MKSLRLVVATLVFTVLTAPTYAQWAVIDGANLSQNTLSQLHSAAQLANQLTQLAHEVQMLDNQAQHLKNLNFTTLPSLLSTLATTSTLIDRTQSMAFNLAQPQQTLTTTYPVSYGSTVGFDQLNSDSLW